jgi:two-component system phosphate regulon sensor histidine kinase PhoR
MSLTLLLEIACLFSVTAAACLALALATVRGRAAAQGTAHRSTTGAMHERIQDLESEIDMLGGEYIALFERCGAGVLVLDSRSMILRANARASEWIGTPTNGLRGKSLLEATLSRELQGMFDAARGEGCVQRDVRLRAHGADTVSTVTVASVKQPAHDGEHFILIAQDVTHVRYLETVRRDFVTNVSHELRTPLTGIRAIAETLQNGAMEDRPALDRFLKMIVNETDRLTRISNDLLVLSAAESRAPDRASVDISSLVCRVAHRYEEQAERAGMVLATDIEPGLLLWANEDQIEQIAVNLVDNAVKYTPAGGRVLVAARRSGDAIEIAVKDTGIGILQQDVPRIFERFYRVDEGRSRETGGTGLGLSIVKHMAEAHGGHVGVESVFNHGSTFTVTLPATRPAAEPQPIGATVHAHDPHTL